MTTPTPNPRDSETQQVIRKTAVGTVTVIAVIVGICCVLPALTFAGLALLGNLDSKGAAADVELVDCSTTAGRIIATMTVKNSTSETQDYLIKVGFYAEDTQVGEGHAEVRGLPPGQKVDTQAYDLLSSRRANGCDVLEVRRQ